MARLEALLFVSPGPASISQLAAALQQSTREVEQALAGLEHRYAQGGLRIQHGREGVQITTAPELAEDVERFLELESVVRLSRAALEVLAIISYEQPITRPQIDAIRGVNSDSSLHTLLRYGLIVEAGRSGAPGRPILYETSSDFLGHFGLQSLADLPPLLPRGIEIIEPDSGPGEPEDD